MNKVEVKEYPEAALKEVTDYYEEALTYYFEAYSSQYSDFPYATEEEFAPDFFGLAEGTVYEDWLKETAESEVRYNMIINHIMDKEKISLSKDEKAEQVKALAEYYAANYSQQYGSTITVDEIIAQFGEEALAEEALYNKVFEFLADNITIVEKIVEKTEE
jgi:FKBP-type peptidyl-prolyl cis-trans isomerase (trigger factor)